MRLFFDTQRSKFNIYKARNYMDNSLSLQLVINHAFLNQVRKDKNLTFSDLEGITKIPQSTIKNILLGNTQNPGTDKLLPICKALDIPIELAYEPGDVNDVKSKIEKQGIKNENASIMALKEIYEHQIASIVSTNEAHINNIRTHYEQHHNDLVDNFEKRLSDKREIIDSSNAHISSLKKELLFTRIAFLVCCSILVGILILEVANPNRGWIRF